MFLDFFELSANLKNVPRQGWIDKLSLTDPESVADHSFSMAVIGMVLSDFKNYNTEKILKMILLHDLAESITGDFTPEQKTKEMKKKLENKIMKKIILKLPKKLQNDYLDIWREFQKNKTVEATFVHQIDKFEMALQAKVYQTKNNSKKTQIFFKTAEKEIKDIQLTNLIKKLKKR